MSDLPEGWTESTLADVIAGGLFSDGDWVESKDQDPDGDVRLIQLADVGDGNFRNRSRRFLTRAKAAELRCTFLVKGDILVARMPEPLGRACIFPGVEQPAVTAVDVCIVRPGSSVHRTWLLNTINSPRFRAAMEEFERGTTRKRISRTNLGRLPLPLPPLAEQRRIVAKVEALLADVNAAHARLAKVPAILKRFRQSVLAAACSGRLTEDWRSSRDMGNVSELLESSRQIRAKAIRRPPVAPFGGAEFDAPEHWGVASFDELVVCLTSGSRAWSKYYRDDGPSTFVMAQNVRPLRFDPTVRQGVEPPPDDPDRQRTRVVKDDLLITIVGANTGDVCRMPVEPQDHYVCQSVALARPVIADLARYLELFLNSPAHGRRLFEEWIYGEGRPHLSFDQLRTTPIVLPPLPEQHEIVRRVDALFALADDIAARVAGATAGVNRLTQAILAKAFRGELVPPEAELARREGCSYEPASVLLERIRAERGQAGPRRDSRRRLRAMGAP